MSQMQSATPQGLQGLMQQRPQAPQMPTPGKASPMAGLGSVDDRVSAYQGNTKPLEQRYAMSQDLLDLLALQKIKSQKDAAARQMQLQMAQQGQQDGQANMTVAEQRAQEVEALTKNELAQQRGDTAQKQAGDQQAMMQKMMGGVASAPGAATAAQPKMFASGGIIGYAGGGDVDAARARRRAAQQKLQSFGTMQRRSDPDGYAAAQQELEAAQAALQEAEGTYAGEMSAAGVSRPAFSRRDVGAVKGAMQEAAGLQPLMPAPAARPASVSEAQATAAAGPQAAVPPAAAPKPPMPMAPKPPAPAGIAGLPGAAPAAPAGPAVGPANDFGSKLEAAALKNAEIDPAARQLSEEERITNKLALTPDQRKVYDEGIAGLQSMYKEQYDPERQRQEGIKRALIGAGGRRYGVLAGAAQAGMAYDDQQRAAKLKEFGDVQKARTGLIDIDRANVKGGIDAGMKAYEQGSLSQRQGLDSGTKLYSTDVDTRNKALDREVERLKATISAEANRIQREGLDQNRAIAQISNIEKWVTGEVGKLEERMQKDPRIGMLMMKPADKLTPVEKNELETAQIAVKQAQKALEKKMEPVLAAARSKLGISATTLSPEDKAAIEKYTKGK